MANQHTFALAVPPTLTSDALEAIVDDPRYAGSAQDKRAICEALAQYGTLTATARVLRIGQQTIWRWRQEDQAFDHAIRGIQATLANAKKDTLEDVLDDLAIKDRNLLAIFFRLKKLDPSYRDNYKPDPAGHAGHQAAGPAVDTESVSAWQGMLDALGLAGLADDIPEHALLPEHASDAAG